MPTRMSTPASLMDEAWLIQIAPQYFGAHLALSHKHETAIGAARCPINYH